MTTAFMPVNWFMTGTRMEYRTHFIFYSCTLEVPFILWMCRWILSCLEQWLRASWDPQTSSSSRLLLAPLVPLVPLVSFDNRASCWGITTRQVVGDLLRAVHTSSREGGRDTPCLWPKDWRGLHIASPSRKDCLLYSKNQTNADTGRVGSIHSLLLTLGDQFSRHERVQHTHDSWDVPYIHEDCSFGQCT